MKIKKWKTVLSILIQKKIIPTRIKLPESTFLQRVTLWNETKNESIKNKQKDKSNKTDDECTFSPQIHQLNKPRFFDGQSFYEKNIQWANETAKITQRKVQQMFPPSHISSNTVRQRKLLDKSSSRKIEDEASRFFEKKYMQEIDEFSQVILALKKRFLSNQKMCSGNESLSFYSLQENSMRFREVHTPNKNRSITEQESELKSLQMLLKTPSTIKKRLAEDINT